MPRIAAVLLGAALAAASPAAAADPAFRTLDGRPASIPQLRGKVVLAYFWASWCGPCREAGPFMQELQEEFGADGFVVAAINSGDSVDEIREYLAGKPVTYRLWRDPSRNAYQKFGLRGFPGFVLFGRDGMPLFSFSGFGGDFGRQLRGHVAALVANK